LAKEADVSVETIKRPEKMKGPLLAATGTTLAKIEAALSAAGVSFLENGDVAGGPGVSLRGQRRAALSATPRIFQAN
jgi:hypothetical protein